MLEHEPVGPAPLATLTTDAEAQGQLVDAH
jgi:hypothetical protein